MADKTREPRLSTQEQAGDQTASERAATLEQHAAALRQEAQRLTGEATDLDQQALRLEGEAPRAAQGGDATDFGMRTVQGIPQTAQEAELVEPTRDDLRKYGNYAYIRKHPK